MGGERWEVSHTYWWDVALRNKWEVGGGLSKMLGHVRVVPQTSGKWDVGP